LKTLDFSSKTNTLETDFGYEELGMSDRSCCHLRFLTVADRLVPIIFAPRLKLELAGKQIFKFETEFTAILFPVTSYVYNLNFSSLSYMVHEKS
jgi:hypothetical protein